MGRDIEVTATQLQTAQTAIMTQLAATDVARDYESLAHAMEQMGLWEFVENQASVVAHLHAFSIRDNAIIHNLVHGES